MNTQTTSEMFPVMPESFQDRHVGISVHLKCMGTTLALKGEEKAQAAESYGIDVEMFNAGRKIINTKNPFFRAITTIQGQIKKLWSSVEFTLPWVEDGTRLIDRSRVSAFLERFEDLTRQLDSAVYMLRQNWQSVKNEARELLKARYNEADYPADPTGLFGATVEFPNLTVPEHLKSISPDLYEKAQATLAAKFDRAEQKAADYIGQSLLEMIQHLADRLKPGEDGKQKKFQSSTVENLKTFLDHVRGLKLSTSAELQSFLDRADELTCELDPAELRRDGELRAEVMATVERLQTEMEATIVTKARRKLLLDDGPVAPTTSGAPKLYSPDGDSSERPTAGEARGAAA